MIKHGTVHGYGRGCRCIECRAAKAEAYLKEKASRTARLKADPSIRPHGNRSTYHNWGCRCEPCCAAQVRRHRQQDPRRTRMLYVPRGPLASRMRGIEPFGREWLDDSTVRTA